MKKLIMLLAIILFAGQVKSQNAVWYFGNQGGVTFNSCAPNPSTGTISINSTAGCTIVSDQDNHVLFYSDGVNVWDESGTNLSSSLLGGSMSTQAALAVPIPMSSYSSGQGPSFLIFTTVGINESKKNDIGVSLITTSSPTYPYNVSVSNDNAAYIFPYMNSTDVWSEKLACTSDGHKGYWVFVHNFHEDTTAANTFYSFHLDFGNTIYATLNSSASWATWLYNYDLTQQSIGENHNAPINNNYDNAMGQMKFSKRGDMLGLVLGGNDSWEVFTFDPVHGTLSNMITNDVEGSTIHGYYGCEFSPGEQYFYTTDGIGNFNYNSLRQWTLTPPISSTTIASNSPSTHDNSLQIERECGPIYCARLNEGSLSVIANPDNPFPACGYSEGTVPIAGGSKKGLPSYYVLTSPIPLSPCSQQCNTSIGPISVPVKSNGEGTVTLTLNSGQISPTYIRIDWANFQVSTPYPECQKYGCGMSTENMGMIVPSLPTIHDFTALLTPYSTNGSETTFSRELVYSFQGANGDSPQPINNLPITLNLQFPFISDISCCEPSYSGSFMVTYIDSTTCTVCQSLIFTSDTSQGSNKSLKKPSSYIKPSEDFLKTKEVPSHSFKVYPNPNDGTFTISTSNLGSNLPYEVMDDHGRLLTSGTLNGNQSKISMSNYSSGVYYVRVMSGSNKYTEKLVLQK